MSVEREAPAAADATLELKVDNMAFLLEQMGRDCAPEQMIRELTVNSIQAIQATESGTGHVVWDHDPWFARQFGAHKLAIVDTGVGMTGPEMVHYINHLASSGHAQSADGNFGVGAKIAAATRNPAGMVYLSWNGGEGAMIWFWRNPETGRYGLKPLAWPDGRVDYWAPAPAGRKPRLIGRHGTVVVLLGERPEDETVGPPRAPADAHGVAEGAGEAADAGSGPGAGAAAGGQDPAAESQDAAAGGRGTAAGEPGAAKPAVADANAVAHTKAAADPEAAAGTTAAGTESAAGTHAAAGPDALWLTRYLNARFFEFPAGIDVRVRERWGTPASRPRPARGMRHFLELAAQASGAVELGGATAHWWILPDGGVPAELAARYPAGGHVGALFQGELYELYTGRSGTAKLQSFGIAVGHARVVLYVEPRAAGGRRVAATTSRTGLLIDSRPLPWGEWAEAFRSRLPREIQALMEEVVGARDARDRTRAFKERMKSLAGLLYIGGAADEKLLRLFAPQRKPRGDAAGIDAGSGAASGAAGDAALAGTASRESADAEVSAESGPESRDRATDAADSDAERDATSSPSGSPGSAGDSAADARRRAGKPPRLDLDRLMELEVAWVPESECGAYDRAAHYIAETNTLLMNRDFRVFAEYVERWRAKYEGSPATQREVEELVREWLEQPLRELIIRSHFLRGREAWSEEGIRSLLSDEALTAVSLPCYLTEMRLRTAVAQRLGRLRPARAA